MGPTVRVVHLLDAASAGGAGLIAALISDWAAFAGAARERHELFLLGGSEDVAACRRAGFVPSAALAPPLREPLLAAGAIRSRLAQSAPDALVAWGVGALAVGLTARCPLSFAAAVGPSHGVAASFARRRLRARMIPAVAFEESIARDTAEVLDLPASVVSAPIDARRIAQDRRALREAWGVDEETLAVGLLADPVRWGDARRAADAVGMPRVRGARVRLLLHPASARLAATRAWLDELALGDLFLLEPRLAEPWQIVAGLDLALIAGDGVATCGASADGGRRGVFAGPWSLRPRGSDPLPALWARAAGVPTLDLHTCDRTIEGRRVALSRAVLACARESARQAPVVDEHSSAHAAQAIRRALRLPPA